MICSRKSFCTRRTMRCDEAVFARGDGRSSRTSGNEEEEEGREREREKKGPPKGVTAGPAVGGPRGDVDAPARRGCRFCGCTKGGAGKGRPRRARFDLQASWGVRHVDTKRWCCGPVLLSRDTHRPRSWCARACYSSSCCCCEPRVVETRHTRRRRYQAPLGRRIYIISPNSCPLSILLDSASLLGVGRLQGKARDVHPPARPARRRQITNASHALECGAGGQWGNRSA